MPPTGSEIRESFLKYFESKGHRRVHSSSLVPHNDPTLLFTNAGMNQFKDLFLGVEKREYNKAASSQKCVRAGGKHNDLENVGFTHRHHTFFEMLGNFSFGDYFKKEAIEYAMEFITSPAWLGIDKGKLYFTIFKGEQGVPRDDEAETHWIAAGAPKERVFAMGMKDNFWQMGDTGPCGPCSEMHYDMGPAASDKHKPECAAGSCKFPCECGRYVEIWNLVFMQFDRDTSGKLTPLPKPCVDTGMGLERISTVVQGVISNYETDLFTPLIHRAAQLTGVSEKKELEKEERARGAASLRVIADHARAVTFLISDGVLPANDGRGYVLRKILRRAIRHGRMLGCDYAFMDKMADTVVDQMKNAYPELAENHTKIAQTIRVEEDRFAHTLKLGLVELEQLIKEAKGQYPRFVEYFEQKGFRPHDPASIHSALLPIVMWENIDSLSTQQFWDEIRTRVPEIAGAAFLNMIVQDAKKEPALDGRRAFTLYDTFGFPLDFMTDAARDAGLTFDQSGFDSAMQQQREQARASWKGGTKQSALPAFRELPRTEFEGYNKLFAYSNILAIIRSGASVTELNPGEEGEVVLDTTPFYAESGGQVGDVGTFKSRYTDQILAEVVGCYQPVHGLRAHKVRANERLIVRDQIHAVVNENVRLSTERNHTGTHLLHAALREILGKHVKQAGSLVDPRHLRFDFSHFTHVADEELQDIEDLTNKEVLKNTAVEVINDVPIDVAINEYKAMALFGEKYGDKVRVIKIGDFSIELCGGTHTQATGEIGLVKLLHESSVSSGVRRVEAVTGEGSLERFRHDRAATELKKTLADKEEELKKLRKELEQVRMKSASAQVNSATDQVKEVNGIKVLAQRVDNLDRGQMRTLVDNLRNKLGSGVVVLGSVSEVDVEGEAGAKIKEKKVSLICGVTKDLVGKVHAGKLVGEIAKKVGGSGGGLPDMAEAGGKDASALDAALQSLPDALGKLAQP